MRFAGDLFSAFRPGGDAFGSTEKNIMGADREARRFIKEHPWSLGAVGYGLKETGTLDKPAPGLRGLGAIGGLAGSFGGDQAESKSPFPIGGLAGGFFS
tara:strand:- start:524 stop:820 length:297 start_codon:yes stop_codon:yes gene_type:complete